MSEEQGILQLFERLSERDEEIKDLREEMKDAISMFCEEFEQFEPKAIKDGYRFFKKLAKDKSSTVDAEFQRDKIVELLIGSN
jgi:hypothetical protein